MTRSSNQVSSAVRSALFLSAVAAAAAAGAPAMAADAEGPAAPEASAPAVQEVIVTGSRIRDPNLVSMSPISTVSADDIQATGYSRVEDVLNNLPMVFAGQNSTVSNGADGTATVDLRGLGPERTLVLVNGRRLGPGFGDGRNFSDINQIPAQLIQRVDVLTGGESAVYGADAVAGVVNFVLDTHFQGIKVDASYDFHQHHQHNAAVQFPQASGFATPDSNVNTGFGKNVSVLIGANFDDNKGNATFYATFDKAAAVLEGKYDYAACTLNAHKGNTLACGGSGTSAKDGAGGYFQAYGSDGTALFTNTVDGKTGAFRPFQVPGDLYNYGPLNFYQRPNERWTAGSFINYDINEHLTAYGEAMFSRNTSAAQIAASGDFFTTTFIPCANPLLTAEERGVICSPANLAAQGQTTGMNLYIGRRNVEGGGRVATFNSNTMRILTGLRGDIAEGWNFDVYAQRSSVDSSNGNLNYFSAANVANALNVVTDPATGQPTCQSVLNGTDPLCVPWNIWVPNGVTKAALNYLQVPLLVEATTTEQVVSGSVTGNLGQYGIQLPTASAGLQVNVGAEWRSESADFVPDYLSIQGNAEGAGGSTLPNRGAFHVRELFTEFSLPIANEQAWAQSLTFNGGYRYSDYSVGFKTNTYMARLEWAPVGDVRFRASYQRAVRAPNILELYGPQTVGLDGSQDPCAGPTPVGTAAQCALAGVTDKYGSIATNPAGQYNGFIGGNPNLQPEKADTYSAGIVFTPHWVENLNLAVDYYNIKVANVIGPVGGDTIVLDCIFTGNPGYCGAIHRDANGSLFKTNAGFVTDPNVNQGKLLTRGIDIKADYRVPLPALGSVSFNLEGTKLVDITTQPLSTFPVSYNCEGVFGTTCGAPQPAWRHVFSTTWHTPWSALDLTARWRYIGSASSQQTTSNLLLTGNPLPLTSHIPAYNYIDLTGRIRVYKSVMLQVGVNNLADKDPPIIPTNGGGYGNDCPTITPRGSSCNGNTFPGTYDALGRFFFAHASVQF